MQLRILKLSEAIRIGAKIRPQAIGDYFRSDKGENICSCTLGAAYEAIFGLPYAAGNHWGLDRNDAIKISNELAEVFPFMKDENYICCPDDCEYSLVDYTLNGVIAHFNDDHKMTREEIAEWLEARNL